jgi:hypothetical protein
MLVKVFIFLQKFTLLIIYVALTIYHVDEVSDMITLTQYILKQRVNIQKIKLGKIYRFTVS